MSKFLGSRIADLRKRLGYSQVGLATKINVSKSTVGMWETGDREPSIDTLKKLADLFDVSIDYLLGRTDFLQSTFPDDETSAKLNLLNLNGSPLTKDEILECIVFVQAKRSINNK